ncbi:hypothetical protein H8N00_10395 [Streptomyces sp. AC563]|uniref:hypothetical protein n=1 Tax=Streptomyces buecherae TaxID=2763006 RepID=UPI00164EAE57|nr:hypothetical protein [Streptomyces buecherae]MBC3989280.1 hypothetical protein [Streptomyces buecherae]
MVEIPVVKLKAVVDALMERFDTNGQVLEIDREEFWSVSVDEAYDVYSEPQDLTIGTLSESWSHLEDMLVDPERVVSHGFIWLADVFRALGDEATHQDFGKPHKS